MKRLSILSSVVIVILLSISSCNKKGNTVNTSNEIDYVDLGLSVMWATCNIGASVPEEVGNYYAWGETENKRKYTWSTYKYCNRSSDKLTKYCYNKAWGNDKVDNKGFLDLSDDVANIKYGGTWHIPTIEELEELHECCTWSWTTINGVLGYKITSNISGFTDRSIFIPVTGYYDEKDHIATSAGGYYWANSLSVGGGKNASSMYFSSEYVDWYHDSGRNCGLAIRPVCLAERNIKTTTSDDIQISIDATPIEVIDNAKGVANNHEWVDLGLSVMWASCNVGANVPSEYGDYYAWGEIETKQVYKDENYKWYDISKKTRLGDYLIMKYNTDDYYGIVDNKKELESKDDVAAVKWGDKWRIPTYNEWNELRTKCVWTWTEINGIFGYEVTSKNNTNSIFLPAAGMNNAKGGEIGHYWSSNISYANCAYSIDFDSKYKKLDYYPGHRCNGHSVRPVYALMENQNSMLNLKKETNNDNNQTKTSFINEKEESIVTQNKDRIFNDYVDLGLSVLWATCNVGASKPEEYGNYYAWGETTTKEEYTMSNYKYYSDEKMKPNKYNEKDSKKTLELIDDIARQELKGEWRIPTAQEIEELVNNCTWKWTTINGINGYKVISNIKGFKDNYIFLPASGAKQTQNATKNHRGFYISSSLKSDFNLHNIDIYFTSDEVVIEGIDRFCGKSVRPVRPKNSKQTVYYYNGDELETNYYYNGHEYVDLGLSVKWATCNIGASSPEEYGDYYAWGEIESKSSYRWTNYKFNTGGDSVSYVKLSKYMAKYGSDAVDNKSALDLQDDVARQKWSGSWHIPTKKEFNELMDNCTWSWTTMNGVSGYEVTSRKWGYTDRSIFLPAAGLRDGTILGFAGSNGYYWSSSLYTDFPYNAYCLYLSSGSVDWLVNDRYSGFPVRPVCP